VPAPYAWALLLVTAGNAFVLYAWAGRSQPAVLLPLLAVSVWHIVENDLGLGRAYRRGMQLGRVGRGETEPFGSVGISALILALALARLTPEDLPAFGVGGAWTPLGGAACRVVAAGCGVRLLARRGVRIRLLGVAIVALAAVPPGRMPGLSNASFDDLFTAVTLYHLVSWLVFASDRVRASGSVEGTRRVRGLLWVHVPPAVLCAGLLAWPAAEVAAVRQVVFSPAIYLFWSVLHVAQTARARGARAGAASGRRCPGAGERRLRDERNEEACVSPP
jgi:hypothetical protein